MSSKQKEKLKIILEETPQIYKKIEHKGKNHTDLLLMNTKHLNKAISNQRRKKHFLPPITKTSRIEREESPSLLGKFINDLSTEICMSTNEITKVAELSNNQQSSAENSNIPTQTNKTDEKILPTEKNTFMTESLNYVPQKEKTEPPKPVFLQLKEQNKNSHTRLRTYQPLIDENWKFKAGLTISVSNSSSYIPILMGTIEYQAKAIEDQTKLLFDNILYFKQTTMHHNNFAEAFKYMPMKSKIKMNKSLEETCGILLLLPQLILLEFYHFIEKFESVHKIDKEKLKDKYIVNEDECFDYNAQLLTEMMDFFKSCLEVYGTLVKEVDNMMLKPKKFENVLTILEKARYNISSVIMRANNAINNYKSDMNLIEKMLKVQKREYFLNKEPENLTDKMRNQFIFKKNDERQRVIRINNVLRIKKEDLEADNDENKDNHATPTRDHFKSIVVSNIFFYIMLLRIQSYFQAYSNIVKKIYNTKLFLQELLLNLGNRILIRIKKEKL